MLHTKNLHIHGLVLVMLPPSNLRDDLHCTGRNSALSFSLCSRSGYSLDFTKSTRSRNLEYKLFCQGLKTF